MAKPKEKAIGISLLPTAIDCNRLQSTSHGAKRRERTQGGRGGSMVNGRATGVRCAGAATFAFSLFPPAVPAGGGFSAPYPFAGVARKYARRKWRGGIARGAARTCAYTSGALAYSGDCFSAILCYNDGMQNVISSLQVRTPLVWRNPKCRPPAQAVLSLVPGKDELVAAQASWARFAPLLVHLFPELQASAGIIDSPLLPLTEPGAQLKLPPQALKTA